MSVFRSSIWAALAISIFAPTTFGQEIQTAGLPESGGSFRLTPGSSFSASAGRSDRRAKLPAPLKLISDDLSEALQVIENNHASTRTADREQPFASAINGMLKQLDPHSTYFTPKEFRALNDEHRGRYFGVGTSITDFRSDGRSSVYVLSVTKGSPAEVSGLRFGDRVLKVDGKDVRHLDLTAVRDLIRGPEGTTVLLSVERYGVTDQVNIRARRANLPEPSVPVYFIANDGIGYIALTEGFGYTTAAEFDHAFEKLRSRGMRALIVDLRGNGGGIMQQAIAISEKFLPMGRTIVSQHGRQPMEERVFRSKNRKHETLPLIVLVDKNTASASEIFAAAMQDNDRAVIVGERTFGKGLVQDVIPLENGAGLVLTSERYYAPSGRSIQRDYSDSGLYDYFRHISKSSLIDKPSFAARTAKGRVVYGGDGIHPDVAVPSEQWSAQDLAAYDTAFFAARENVSTDPLTDKVRQHLEWFKLTAAGNRDAAAKAFLDKDPQFRAAIAMASSKLSETASK